MSNLAKLASHEILAVIIPPLCRIEPIDIGDEDRHDVVFDVYDMNGKLLSGFFNTYPEAIAWTQKNGYIIDR